ncbi:hypothetical protein [Macrococcus animalis]|uniref:hypothetical protein n=1 Tax=Macrococcus animalis TaxID=3395467 RepID=UPI0039BDCF15
MNFGDKLFILFLNACWMFFIYYIVRGSEFGFKHYIPFLIPLLLLIVCLVMLFQLREEATKDVEIRNFEE